MGESMAINLTVYVQPFGREHANVPSQELPTMPGTVPVAVFTAGQSYQFDFGRVSNVGETIRINFNIYTVRSVLHTPQFSHAAEIHAELTGTVTQ